MSGVKGRSGSGGARPGSGPKPKPRVEGLVSEPKPRGHPKGVPGGGHDGRQPGAVDKTLNPARLVPMAEKWNFAEQAYSYAQEMLNRMVELARNAESETVRLAAQNSILDRALGKAPQHVDVSAVRHTEIVYRSAQEIRQELINRGVPLVLLDYDKSDKP